MPVLDATPLETDPQGTALLGSLLSQAGGTAGRERARGARASFEKAAEAAQRRASLIAGLRGETRAAECPAEVWLDPSPA